MSGTGVHCLLPQKPVQLLLRSQGTSPTGSYCHCWGSPWNRLPQSSNRRPPVGPLPGCSGRRAAIGRPSSCTKLVLGPPPLPVGWALSFNPQTRAKLALGSLSDRVQLNVVNLERIAAAPLELWLIPRRLTMLSKPTPTCALTLARVNCGVLIGCSIVRHGLAPRVAPARH